MTHFYHPSRSFALAGLCVFLMMLGFNGAGLATEGKVDVNLASTEELQKVSGIGKELAKRIVEYRNDHGPFTTLDELKKVKGIGKGNLAKIQDHLTINISSQSEPLQ